MHRRRDGLAGQLEVQALYSIVALARFARLTRYKLRRILRSNGIQLVRIGRAVFVPLSEIERKIPPLWASICAAEKIRRIAEISAGKDEKLGRPGASRAQTP
jgi:hypothetical protein